MMCSARARVTFNSDRMDDRWPALIIRSSRRPGTYRVRPAVYGGPGEGTEGNIGPPSPERRQSVQPGPPPHHTVLGDKQENRFSHSGQFTSWASLSGAICQSLSLRAGCDGEPLTRLAVRVH